MSLPEPFRVAVLGVVKHAYVPNGVATHPRFELVVVADDPRQPDWVHERNQAYAAQRGIPYVRGVGAALRDYRVQVAVVCSEAERHCDLGLRAADSGVHVISDKPMSNRVSDCDRMVEAVERNNVRFLMWNRNLLPAIVQARKAVREGEIGALLAIHADFYFAKDAGPPLSSQSADAPKLNWLKALQAAHSTGADGGIGKVPLGELAIEGCYPLAYIAMLGGSRVAKVFARMTAHFHQLHADNGVEDLATVSFELESGVAGTLAVGRIGNASHPDIGEIKLHLLGASGGMVVTEARPEVGIHYQGQPPEEFKNQRILEGENDYWLADGFAQAIDQGRATLMDARASRHIAATTAAALESGRTGRVVEVLQ